MAWKKLAFLDEVAALSGATPLAVDNAAAEGANTLASRDDHVHILGANVVDNSTIELTANVLNVKANGISNAEIAANTITAAEIANNAIEAAELADDAVDENAIADNAVNTPQIAANAVNVSKIAPLEATLDCNQQQADGLCLEVAAEGPDSESEAEAQIFYNNSDDHPYVWVPA